MAKKDPAVVRISTPSDVICAITRLLGFVPSESVVALCTHGDRCRLGLAMRFDLAVADDPQAVAAEIDRRVRHENAEGVFIVVFTSTPAADDQPPHLDVIDWLGIELGDRLIDAFYTTDGRWWSYLCHDQRCCPPGGTPVDTNSPGATALAAAYALQGQGVLPSREAVAATIAFAGDDDAASRMAELIEGAFIRHQSLPRSDRQLAVRSLLSALSAASHDPRAQMSDPDVAELAALCEDVVVRDEVLVRAVKPRRRSVILRLLAEAARRVPEPYDAPICATLAFVAYVSGDGVIANVALDRVFATDPTYSLGHLIADALDRQVPPWVLEKVMKGAARDLSGRSAAG